MDAVLEKIRMPRTTTTAVVMLIPRPAENRGIVRQATTTFQKNDVTNTRSREPSFELRAPRAE